jgi:hypothetical protein
MPFLEFPPTTGPWAVGQCDVLWKEEEVNELGSPGGAGGGGSAADKKKLVVRIFYPSPKEPEGGKEPPRAAWLPQTYGAKWARRRSIAHFRTQHSPKFAEHSSTSDPRCSHCRARPLGTTPSLGV